MSGVQIETRKSSSNEFYGHSNVPWMIFTTGVYVILGIILPFLQYYGGFISYSHYLGGSNINERMDFYWNIMEYSTQLSSGSKNLVEIASNSSIGLIWIILQIWGIIWLVTQIITAIFLILPIIDKIKHEKTRKIELTKLGLKIGLIGTGVEYLLYLIVMIFEKWELDFGAYILPETPSVNLFLLIGFVLAWFMYYLGYTPVTAEFPGV